jgi:cytochrome c oxidase cbb3-type subunit 3
MSSRFRASCLIAAALALGACQREARHSSSSPIAGAIPAGQSPDTIYPGGGTPPPLDPRAAKYDNNAPSLAEGQALYTQMNCVGCHAHGGGGMGPALMDDKWRYGGKPEQIVDSILRGRPNGMPAFQDKIPEQQAWELAAYVRALSGNADKLAAPSRADDMRSIPPINNIDRQPPKSDAAASKVGGT